MRLSKCVVSDCLLIIITFSILSKNLHLPVHDREGRRVVERKKPSPEL